MNEYQDNIIKQISKEAINSAKEVKELFELGDTVISHGKCPGVICSTLFMYQHTSGVLHESVMVRLKDQPTIVQRHLTEGMIMLKRRVDNG